MAAKAEATKRYLTKIDDPLASKYYRGWVECLDYLEENGYLCSKPDGLVTRVEQMK